MKSAEWDSADAPSHDMLPDSTPTSISPTAPGQSRSRVITPQIEIRIVEAVGVDRDGQQAGKRPAQHQEALEEHAADHPDARRELVGRRTRGLHPRCDGHDRHEVGQHHPDDGVPGVVAQRGRPEQLEHVRGNALVEAGQAADMGQPDGYEQHREDDDQRALNRVGQGRRAEASQHRVDAHDEHVAEVEPGLVHVRHERAQFAALLLLPQFVGPRPFGRGERRGGSRVDLAQLGEFRDALALGGRAELDRLRRHRHGRLRRDEIADAAADQRRQDEREYRVGRRQEPALEPLGEVVAHRREPHAAEEHHGEPVERRQEQDQRLDRHPADALAIHLARHRDGLVGVRRRAEVQEELEGLPEFPARQEEVVERRDFPCGALAEPQHDDEVDDDEGEVDGVESPELHDAPGCEGRGRGDSP